MNFESSSVGDAAKMGTASWRPMTDPAQAARQGREAAFRKARRLKAKLPGSWGRTRGVGSTSCKSYFIGLPPRDSRFQIPDSRFQIQNPKSCGPFFVAIRLPPRDSRFQIQNSRFQIQDPKSCHQTSTTLIFWG